MECICCKNQEMKSYKKYSYNKNSLFEKIFPGLWIYECLNCRLLQINHSQIYKNKLNEYYKNYYRSDGNHTDKKPASKNWYKARGEALLNLFLKNSNKKNITSIFEIGAGYGYNLDVFRNVFTNAKLYTDELNKECTDFLRYKNITISSMESNCYDLIIMSHVLEHLLCPVEVINNIYESLNKDGFLIIEVPNSIDFHFEIEPEQEPHITFFNAKTIDFFFKHNFSKKFDIKCITTAGPSLTKIHRNLTLKKFLFPLVILKRILKYVRTTLIGKIETHDFSNDSTSLDGLFLRIILQKVEK